MRIDVVQATRPPQGRLAPEREAAMAACASAGTRILIRVPAEAPSSIASAYEDAIAAPAVLAEVRAAARDGADAVVINCTADTAVEAAREAVRIPVIGVAEASFHLAAQLCDRFSVLTFAERIAARFAAMARRWGMAERLASVRSVEIPLESAAPTPRLAAALAAAARVCLAADRAQAIILGCTDFELAAAGVEAALLAEGTPVPLLRPFAIGLHLAEGMVRMGLSQSPLAYPPPRLLGGASA